MAIHDVDSTQFEYGDYNITIKLKYWERLPTEGYSEAYEVTVNVSGGSTLSGVTNTKSAPVHKTKWDGFFSKKTVKTDVSELVIDAWKDMQERIDKVSDRTSGNITVDFEVGTESAEEHAELVPSGHEVDSISHQLGSHFSQ